jgi:hypothetical protein
MRRRASGLLVGLLAPVLLVGCDDEEAGACAGRVTKTYTTTSVSGGFSGVPASSSTAYRVTIKREDGTACSRKLKRKVWEAVEVGNVIDEGGQIVA